MYKDTGTEGCVLLVMRGNFSPHPIRSHIRHETSCLQASAAMAKLAKKGINSFKFFMAYKGTLQVTDEELVAGFERCKQLGAVPMV